MKNKINKNSYVVVIKEANTSIVQKRYYFYGNLKGAKISATKEAKKLSVNDISILLKTKEGAWPVSFKQYFNALSGWCNC